MYINVPARVASKQKKNLNAKLIQVENEKICQLKLRFFFIYTGVLISP